jgi:hypothetical protein
MSCSTAEKSVLRLNDSVSSGWVRRKKCLTGGRNAFTISKGNFEEFPSEVIFSTDVHSGPLKVGSGPIEQKV